MPAFARALVEIHQLAQEADADEFPAEVLHRLGGWIGFDGAVLGLGDAGQEPSARLDITEAHVHARDPAILSDYRALSADDPVTAAFVAGLAQPLAVDCRSLYRARRLEALESFARVHGLRHLMLFGDAPARDGAGRWLVLYRSDDVPFTATDAERLHAAWLHVACAIGQHRAALLDRYDPHGARRASALVDGQGRLHAADRRFIELLCREWPGCGAGRLPEPLQACLAGAQPYRGRLLEIRIQPRGRFRVCTATPVRSVAALTPGENAVARRFAAGMSHKEVARELGVSPHTVRAQLATLYAKLGVHDKAALAQRFIAQAEGTSG
ncbi:helix-turn-helix transcriptional regulator [Azohydromonas aeria]|uniref:helix-turn-helix transcriptional regulator n=1 Tax=Azohydromonas aeria TaxID=2590212 RepID=UPI0012F99843|nr:helix-turn-helix transcriptional regulator [Azohydromonas aeria]